MKNDFVFLDHRFRPYRIRLTNEGHWLHYWNDGPKNWVTLRKAAQWEVDEMFNRALPLEQQKLYEAGVPFLTEQTITQLEDKSK